MAAGTMEENMINKQQHSSIQNNLHGERKLNKKEHSSTLSVAMATGTMERNTQQSRTFHVSQQESWRRTLNKQEHSRTQSLW